MKKYIVKIHIMKEIEAENKAEAETNFFEELEKNNETAETYLANNIEIYDKK